MSGKGEVPSRGEPEVLKVTPVFPFVGPDASAVFDQTAGQENEMEITLLVSPLTQ